MGKTTYTFGPRDTGIGSPITAGDSLAQVAWSQALHVETQQETFFQFRGMEVRKVRQGKTFLFADPDLKDYPTEPAWKPVKKWTA